MLGTTILSIQVHYWTTIPFASFNRMSAGTMFIFHLNLNSYSVQVLSAKSAQMLAESFCLLQHQRRQKRTPMSEDSSNNNK